MAKARNITPVRDRAVKAFRKATHTTNGQVFVSKSRSKQTITVRSVIHSPITWSYKDGSLRKVA